MSPRRSRHFIIRLVYGAGLLLLICTAWMLLNGTQIVRNVGDMARFGSILFQVLAPLQLAVMMFFAAVQTAVSVAVEKDKQTLILLLMSRLTNSELVLGKLFASLLNIGVMLMTSLPIFMLIVLFGGTSFQQVGWSFAVAVVASLAAGSMGNLVAFWREKTFQTLALVVLALVFWLGAAEAVRLWDFPVGGMSVTQLADWINPIRASISASQPSVTDNWDSAVIPFLVLGSLMAIGFSSIAIARVRKWNPNRDLRPTGQEDVSSADLDLYTGQLKEVERGIETVTGDRHGTATRVELGVGSGGRPVWDNPVLWRECCTWAYGRKIVLIRLVYWGLAGLVFLGLYNLIASGEATRTTTQEVFRLHVTARPLIPFMLAGLVVINALAVTSITNERDGRALDLLRVTDISPKEFLFGKILGVGYVVMDLTLLPIGLSVFLAWWGIISVENLCYLVLGWLVMVAFVIVLGLHCGLSYPSSRQAIGVSLGTVFFLLLGIVTAILMMISFTGNVEAQLAPFLACLVGGAIGLYLAMGWHTPSTALVVAAFLLPVSMFHSITSYVLGNYLTVILVLSLTYGFATTAMVVPRLSEFLVSTGRTKTGGHE